MKHCHIFLYSAGKVLHDMLHATHLWLKSVACNIFGATHPAQFSGSTLLQESDGHIIFVALHEAIIGKGQMIMRVGVCFRIEGGKKELCSNREFHDYGRMVIYNTFNFKGAVIVFHHAAADG